MKIKLIAAFLFFPLNLSSQDILYPIFDFKGDSVGNHSFSSPIQIGDKLIDVGRFNEVFVNIEANRIYTLDFRDSYSHTIPLQRYLQIFDFSGNLIYSDLLNEPIINCFHSHKNLDVSSDGYLTICDLKKGGSIDQFFKIIRLDKDGKEIFQKNIKIPNEGESIFVSFDSNSKGEFLFSYPILPYSNEKNKCILQKYDKNGKEVWSKRLKYGSNISLNDSGQIALLINRSSKIKNSKVICFSENGKKLSSKKIRGYYDQIEFKNHFTLNIWNRIHPKFHKRKTIEIKKLKAKQF